MSSINLNFFKNFFLQTIKKQTLLFTIFSKKQLTAESLSVIFYKGFLFFIRNLSYLSKRIFKTKSYGLLPKVDISHIF